MPENPTSPHAPNVPYRMALAEMRAEIEAGHYDDGKARFPSERVLCERFGIARETARRVALELRELGLIRTVWGRGSHVVPAAERPAPDAK